jgi:predicted permease
VAYLAAFHWGWLLASLLLGFAMGWIAVVHRGPSVSRTTAAWLAALVAALVVAAFANVIPGRPGYWLELALMLLAPYLVGCASGSWLRDRVLTRSAPVKHPAPGSS